MDVAVRMTNSRQLQDQIGLQDLLNFTRSDKSSYFCTQRLKKNVDIDNCRRKKFIPRYKKLMKKITRFSFSISHFQFPIFNFPFSISHSPFPIPHSPFPIPHSPFPIPHSPFPIPHSPFPILFLIVSCCFWSFGEFANVFERQV